MVVKKPNTLAKAPESSDKGQESKRESLRAPIP